LTHLARHLKVATRGRRAREPGGGLGGV